MDSNIFAYCLVGLLIGCAIGIARAPKSRGGKYGVNSDITEKSNKKQDFSNSLKVGLIVLVLATVFFFVFSK